MNCKIEIVPRLLHFKQPAGTSRGVYTTRKVWYVHFTSPEFPGRVGVGECAPLPKLSCDDLPDYGKRLADVCRWVEEQGGKLDGEALRDYPSILFGLENAMEKLKRLSELDIHSIEQPIRAGQWEEMARLTSESPLPIALDEELIGCNTLEGKQRLLSAIRPQYIILKPSLHGGFTGGEEWIAEAEKRNIGWWITSALESNIGLNAIAQWCATFNNPLPQGLGTGMLFTDNVDMPLEIRKDCLWFCK